MKRAVISLYINLRPVKLPSDEGIEPDKRLSSKELLNIER